MTTSEPNERESFEKWSIERNFYAEVNTAGCKELFFDDSTWEAWQHQQNRIDELEAKLNIAIEGLKYFQTFSNGAGTATAILENIEKIGE